MASQPNGFEVSGWAALVSRLLLGFLSTKPLVYFKVSDMK